jgi:hypothetical protein
MKPGFLTTENGAWKLTYNGKDYILDSTDVPLDSIVLALEKLYPGLEVELDFRMTPNPWFGKHLFTYAIDALSKEFKDIDLAGLALEFSTTEVKICTKCGEDAYYNSAVNNWQCPECRGHYVPLHRPLRFITKRPIKRNEYERQVEYFGPNKPATKKRIIDVGEVL